MNAGTSDPVTKRLFRRLLTLYPRRFLGEHEQDMLLLFEELEDKSKKQKGTFHLRFLLRAYLDVVSSAARAHRLESCQSKKTKTLAKQRKKRSSIMSTWSHDAKVATRLITKQPGFTLVAAITLALGIGANTAIFSVVYGVLLRPLGLEDPSSVAIVGLHRNNNEGDTSGFFQTYFEDLRTRVEPTPPIKQLTSYIYESVAFVQEDKVEALNNVLMVDGRFFDVMGVKPLLGRTLDETDILPNQRGNVCVLGETLWRSRFAADPEILGQTLTLDDRPFAVVGVVPANVPLPDAATNLWIPQGWDLNDPTLLGRLHVLARLSSVHAFPSAQGVFEESATQLATDYSRFEDYTITLQSFQDGLVGSVRPAIVLTGIAVGLILLIACANTANLLLSRSAMRSTEMATRRAIGARRGQLASQLFTESVTLSLLGGIFGVLVAFGFHRVLLTVAPAYMPRLDAVRLDLPVLAFTALLSLGTGLLFGLAPLVHTLGRRNTLASGTGARVAPHQGFMSHAFVISQVALSVVLLVGAALMVRSLNELNAVDPGFRVDGLAGARVYLNDAAYPEDSQQEIYFRSLNERLRARPEIESAGATSGLPMDPITIDYDLPYTIPGREAPGPDVTQAYFRTITPGYLETMQIPLKAGRPFDGRDKADGQRVAVINETFAEIGWPGENPIGKSFLIYRGQTELNIVGVVGDVHFAGPAAQYKPEFFVPHAQTPYGAMTVVARSRDPERAARIIAEEALALAPRHPIANSFALSGLLAGTLATDRFLAFLLSCFAAIALMISATGIYGVLSYWVSQSRRELGVRMAFGAGVDNILHFVLRRGLGLAALGLGLGLFTSFLLMRFMAGFLFGVGTTDGPALAVVVVILGLSATLSTLIPAWRAAHLDPMISLRQD